MQSPKKIVLFNSLGKQKEVFTPLKKESVSLYCCGPTVYNYAHIGNLRAFLFEDILRRSLEYAGYQVQHVMNITDVGHLTDDGDTGEDKIIQAAREKGMDVWQIADFFTKAFLSDTQKLNLKKPSVVCKATDHIQPMIDFIQILEEKGYAYFSQGNVYFDTKRFPDYGKMAFLDKQIESEEHTRVDADAHKRHPRDFVLWFTQSKFQDQSMKWDSPWGVGYPGWHIECSAMSLAYLGEEFDIHCGGVDHINVHHSNEIAQSDALTGKKSVHYWLHNEFLIVKDGKMSKSQGNFLTLTSLEEEGFHPLDYRYFLLGGHYRSQLVFTWESLKGAQNARKKLLRRIKEIYEQLQENEKTQTPPFSEQAKQIQVNFEAGILDDLNTPRALACLWDVIKNKDLSHAEKWHLILLFDEIFGLQWQQFMALKADSPAVDAPAEIMQLLEKRNVAKVNKDFALADNYRAQILEQGYLILDGADGSKLEAVNSK